MIQIYGPAGSSAGRCFWALEEAGIPYEAVPVDLRTREHKKPEFLALNPNGKVPVLKDGDLVLWESMAINFYLAEKYKADLLGDTAEDKAHVLKWSFWALAEYQKPVIDVFIQKVFVPEDKRNHELIARNLEKFGPLHEVLEKGLRGRDYLVGSTFTLADLNVASVTRLAPMLGFDLAPFPEIRRWLSHVLDRPAALRVAQLERH